MREETERRGRVREERKENRWKNLREGTRLKSSLSECRQASAWREVCSPASHPHFWTLVDQTTLWLKDLGFLSSERNACCTRLETMWMVLLDLNPGCFYPSWLHIEIAFHASLFPKYKAVMIPTIRMVWGFNEMRHLKPSILTLDLMPYRALVIFFCIG